MNRILYILKRIAKMDYSNMLRACKDIRKKQNKGPLSTVGIFTDMVRCGFKYGAGYIDYKIFHFYEMDAHQRSTYVTRTVSNRIVDLVNKPESHHIMANKTEFNEYFSKYIGRKWLDFEKAGYDEFAAFVKEVPVIIVKPMAANCGQGIEKINCANKNTKELYNSLKDKQIGIVEEYVVQCAKMHKLYPHALNTLRVFTILDKNGKAHIIKTMLRMGINGNIVDNINAGGLMTLVDMETGVIKNPATNKDELTFTRHPDTNTKFVGFELPFWKEAMDMCRNAAESIPSLRYIGWDVAFTDNGPILIEGNHIPGHDILQLHNIYEEGKIGMLPTIAQYIPELGYSEQ